MGMFDIFKKKKEVTPDYINLTIHDLDKGFMFDYNLDTWTVDEVYLYDWGNEDFTKEYKINNGKETLFMNIEEDDEVEITIAKKVKIRSVDENLPEYVRKNEQPPVKITYKGIELLLDDEAIGYFKEIEDSEEAWEAFTVWNYYDKLDKHNLSIERWDENSFEASFGIMISEFEITNIFPNPDLESKS